VATPEPVNHPQTGTGGDPGGSSVKASGVWFGGRLGPQVTVRRLNHGPLAEDFTAESVTATGYFANLPEAQLGTHWFSQSVPCPVAAVAVQVAQVRPSILMPASAHASTIADGSVLSGYGSALAQSATTPTSATAAGELGAAACEVAVAVGEGAAAGWAGDDAWPVGAAVAVGLEAGAAAEPPALA
jgi:hypothetical protein